MEVIIDRFEGDFVIVELPDRSMVDMPAILVSGAREGDVVRIMIDKEATEERASHINRLANQLWDD